MVIKSQSGLLLLKQENLSAELLAALEVGRQSLAEHRLPEVEALRRQPADSQLARQPTC